MSTRISGGPTRSAPRIPLDPDAQSELWFRQLLDSAPVLIWTSDATGACTYFNAGWLAYTGRALSEELGDGWASGVHPDDLADCVSTYRSHVEAQTPFRLEYRLRRADGRYGWLLDDGAPRYGEDGRFLGFIGSAVDVTEAKRAQAMTRDSAATLVRHLLRPGTIPAGQTRAAGRQAALQHARASPSEFAHAFCSMGLGEIRAIERAGSALVFAGVDLVERRPAAGAPTCTLALGYLEGALESLRGRPARGEETRCQSLGHEECRFVVDA